MLHLVPILPTSQTRHRSAHHLDHGWCGADYHRRTAQPGTDTQRQLTRRALRASNRLIVRNPKPQWRVDVFRNADARTRDPLWFF